MGWSTMVRSLPLAQPGLPRPGQRIRVTAEIFLCRPHTKSWAIVLQRRHGCREKSPRWDAPRPASGGESKMSRMVLLALAIGSLAAAPGCSSCFGNNSCRRPSFMEFQGGGCLNRNQGPHMPPCGAPACAPCGAPACDPCSSPAPCCEGGGGMISSPASAPMVSEPGTFS